MTPMDQYIYGCRMKKLARAEGHRPNKRWLRTNEEMLKESRGYVTDAILRVLKNGPATAQKIMEEGPVPRGSLYSQLSRLHDQGVISKSGPNNARVYSLAAD